MQKWRSPFFVGGRGVRDAKCDSGMLVLLFPIRDGMYWRRI